MSNLMDELKKGLKGTTKQLNKKRSLWDKYISRKSYSLEEKHKLSSGLIIVARTFLQSTDGSIYADIDEFDGRLHGHISHDKSARPIANFLHMFLHQHGIGVSETLCESLGYHFNKI